MLRQLFGTIITSPFTLQNIPDFPYMEWNQMQSRYIEYSNWYKSVPLTEITYDKTSGTTIDKYPLKINPIPNSCERHATVLLGNTIESIRDSGVPIKFAMRTTDSDRNSVIVDTITDAFIYGGGGALFSSILP